jgi:hypothetical protein
VVCREAGHTRTDESDQPISRDQRDAGRKGQLVARRNWGKRLAIGGTVFVVFLAILLVVADRVGAWYAERTIATQVKSEVSTRGITTDQPDVTVSGFPFLTQVIDGRYKSISIVLRNVEGGGVRLSELDVTATGVTADLDTIRTGQGQVMADEVTGNATVGYATVAALTNQPQLSLSGQNGELHLRMPVTLLGRQVTLVGDAKVSITKGRVRVIVNKLDSENGNLPAGSQSLIQQYIKDLSIDMELPQLPFNLTLDKVTPETSGLAVSATAHSVPLTNSTAN